MRTALKLTSSVVAATAIVVGLSGLSSVANAAEPAPTGVAVADSTPTAGNDARTTEGTQQFQISAMLGRAPHGLVIQDIWGTTGWPKPQRTGFDPADSYPPVGTVVGNVLPVRLDLTFDVRDSSDHGISVLFSECNDANDNGQCTSVNSRNQVIVDMHVSDKEPQSTALAYPPFPNGPFCVMSGWEQVDVMDGVGPGAPFCR